MITYKAGKFIDGSERKLKNLLKKLPGIKVSKNGTVTLQGKTVTKLLVDGKKFFGGNTKLGVNNIPANAVDKLQVIDNYNEVAFLKNLSDSDEMAMNIKLKEDKKRFVFGNVELGIGNKEFFKTNANLFYYSPKTNINFIGNLNNIAEKTFTFRDYISFQGGINAVFNNDFNWKGGDFSQFLKNKDVLKSKQNFGALNITKTTSSKLDIFSYLIISQSKEENYLEMINDYSVFNELKKKTTQLDNLLGIGKLNIEYKANNNEQWFLRAFIKSINNDLDNTIVSRVISQTDTVLTNRDLESIELNQNIEWHKRYSDKNTFSTIVNYNYKKDNKFSFWQTEDDILQGLIPLNVNQNLITLLQSKYHQKHNFDLILKHFWEINHSNHLYTTMGNKYLKESFITDDSQRLDDGTVNNFSNDGYGNNLDYNLNDIFFGLHYKFKTGIFTVKQGINLHNYSWRVNQQNNINKNKWLLLPDFLAKIEFNKYKKLQIDYSLETSFSDVNKLSNRLYLQSYNSVFKGNENLENNLFHKERIYYSRFSLYRGLMIFGSVNYIKQIKGVQNTVEFEGVNQFITSKLYNNPLENIIANLSIEKSIKKVKYKLDLITNNSKYLQEIDNSLQFNKNNSYSYSIGMETLFKNFPIIDIGFKRSIGEFTSNNNISIFITNEPYINIDYDFLKGFVLSFDYSLYDYRDKDLNQNSKFDIANFTLSYRKENSAWTYKTFSNNLFNTGFRRNSSFSQYLISDTKTFILPRIIMFSIEYNL